MKMMRDKTNCLLVLKGLFFFLLACFNLEGQTIAEKKAAALHSNNDLTPEMQKFLVHVNKELKEAQTELERLQAAALDLYNENAPEESYKEILAEINEVKGTIRTLEDSWREMCVQGGQEEEYALWHQPETTLGQLIIDYGSQNYVYLVSSEISSISLSVDSNLPIPRASWNEMLEIILLQNGVGVKQLNSFLRQLYLIEDDKSALSVITNKREDLELLPSITRIGFILNPEPSESRRIWTFLDKFINPNGTVLQMVGRDILIVSSVAEVRDLLKLYDFVAMNRGDKEYKVVALRRVKAEEMSKILGTIFDQFSEGTSGQFERDYPVPRTDRLNNKNAPPMRVEKPSKSSKFESNGLKIIALGNIAQAIFLIGTKEEIKRAEDIISEVENQVGEMCERVIYTYITKHSDPLELAEVLEKIYALMVVNRIGFKMVNGPQELERMSVAPPLPPLPPPIPPAIAEEQIQAAYLGQPFPPANIFDDGYYLDNRHKVNYDSPNLSDQIDPNANRNNFIVDPKTGAIVMVVEVDALPKLKELIKKLDVPKKMVQLEVLLFEKKITQDNNFGLNLLQIGSDATNKNKSGFNFNDILGNVLQKGISTFFISREKNDSFPAFDLVYKFLISQSDIQINASPSILTMNQTPAKIAIEEEISINTGVFEIPATGSVALKNAYARGVYGIKIEITPTIHLAEEGSNSCDDQDYVSMVTDIIFETIHRGFEPNRPDVTRRIINNEVRIPNGQTVILGGLRRKITEDSSDGIPFLGDIPGIGKLFSHTSISENSTEMFIFITPKIIIDPSEELEQLRAQEMARRPGDYPSFLCQLIEAREMEKSRAFVNTMTMLFGPEPGRCISMPPLGEYDGR